MTTLRRIALFTALAASASVASAQTKLFTATGAAHGGRLGSSITLIGDLNGDLHPDFLVGAPSDDTAYPGAGRLLILSGTTGAVIRDQFGTEPGEQFGTDSFSLADLDADGFNEYVVSAPYADANGLVDSGRVTLYSGKTGAVIRTWTGAAAGDHFGASISRMANSLGIVVGAPGRDTASFTDAGAVYLFPNNSTVPIHEWQGGASNAQLGFSVEAGTNFPVETDGVSPNEILAGAPGWTTGASGSGRVQILKTVAPFNVILSIDGSTVNGRFGASIANLNDVSGDGRSDFVVGEPNGGPNAEGRARIISGATGATLKILSLPDGQTGDQFGACVAWGFNFDGDGLADVLVGAPRHTVGGLFHAGTVVAFSSATGGVIRTVNGAVAEGLFGTAIVGGYSLNFTVFNDFIVGAPGTTHTGTDAGAAIQFTGATGATVWTTFGTVTGDHAGTAVTDVGDVNADGIHDWAVGSETPAKIEIYSGANGQKLTTIFAPSSNTLGALAGVGDVNLDGLPDFAVGMPRAYFPTAFGPGEVYVFSGDGSAVLQFYSGTQSFERYGFAVANAGDLDADGRADLVIGAPSYTNGISPGVGRVEARSGATGAVLMNYTANSPGELLGTSVSSAGGDFNGDGKPDIVAGAPGYFAGGLSGRAIVLTPPALFVDTLFDMTAGSLGASVAAAGDLDGDGKPDIVVGAPNSGGQGGGRILAFSGQTHQVMWSDQGLTNEHLGGTIVAIGDLDLDGASDLAVSGTPGIGAPSGLDFVRIVSGKAGASMATIFGTTVGDRFGASLARIADVNGDGLDDLLVGASRDDGVAADAGAAFLYRTALAGTTQFGTGTPGCTGTEHLVTNLIPTVGLSSLQLRNDHVAPSSIGLGLVSNVKDVAGSDIYGVGVLLHTGIIGATVFDGFNAVSDATGHGSAPFGLPNLPGLAGQILYTQTIWSWGSTCALPPFGLSSSRGLTIEIQP